MKKIASLIFSLVCILCFGICAAAGSCDVYRGSNENAQNYSVWATTVKSYLHVCDDGKLMRVQYLVAQNKILVSYYSSSFELVSSKAFTPESSVFGGFYAAEDFYFLLTGKNNPSESSGVACFVMTKYDKDWNKIATAELKDCNTTVPFDAGSARFAHSGKYLVVRTSHEMYKSAKDGKNHQANVTIMVDMTTMKITDSFTSVATVNYGYVSHSFNQFIGIDSGKIVALDHGDAHPRSVVLTKYKTDVFSGKFTPEYYQFCTTVDMLAIAGDSGVNSTGCSVGGFEITSSGYLAAMNSIKQGSDSAVRNIYVSYCAKTSSSPELRQLTYYTESGVSTPQLVKINSDRFILLWSYGGKVNYCELDGKGNVKGSIMSLDGALSDCQPVIYSGRLVWYVWKNSEVTFYGIGLSDLSSTDSATVVSGHKYSISGVNGTSVTLKCSVCADKTQGSVPSSFTIWWEDKSYSSGDYVYYSSVSASSYHPGDTVRLWVRYTAADFNDYEVLSDNPEVAEIIQNDDGYSVRAVNEGTAKITVRSKYNKDINKTYTLQVCHDWAVKESTEATCEKEGKVTKACGVCGKSITETPAAKGHAMGSYKVTKEATCKSTGKKTATCSRCGYTDTAEIPKTDHDSNIVTKGTDATCTKQGKSDGKKCSVCGAVTKTQETIPALGHNLGEYKVTKKATCTAKGEETAECTRCSYTKTRDTEKAAHTEVTVKATAATCTKAGKTEGKKCSVCNKVTVAQETVEALGHDLGEYKITKKATCTAKGEETAECTRCSYTKTRDTEKAAHTEVTVKATAATCTKAGKTEGKKCSVCDKVTVAQETVEALGHNLGEYKITQKATCTAKGEETAECTRCSYTKTRDIEKVSHTEITVKATAATCTKAGKTEGKKCSVCDKVTVAQETVEALGHDLGEYKITKKSTCTAKGEETAECTRCSYTKTRDTEKAAHTEVIVKATAATCTKAGKTEGKKCSVCDKVTVAQETVEALGHNKKITVITTATTQANGKISSVCLSCDENFAEQRVYRISSITLSSTECTYNGKTKTPSVRVTDYNKDTLIKDEDYTVSYSEGRKEIGSYYVRINFIGKYSGSEKLTFTILPGKTEKITATQSTSVIKLKWSEVKGANGYRIYRYNTQTKEYEKIASIKNATEYRVTKLSPGTAYKFAVKAYYKDENGKVYFSSGKKAISTATEPAAPSVTVKSGSGAAVLSWGKCSGADGYQIYYSTSAKGKYKKLKSTSALSFKKTGLTSGKKYYFKVRAYKKTSSETVFGEFSKVQALKVK